MTLNIIYIILTVLGFGFIIFIHELGHYFYAKKVGMKVEIFSIGFGKPFFSWQRGETKWQVCILPFGGYVKVAGTEKKGSLQPHEIKDGYFSKKPIDRIKVSIAGPLANILLAFFLFFIIWIFGGRVQDFKAYTKKIGFVDNHSKLYQNGVRDGDEVLYLKNKKYQSFADFFISFAAKDDFVDIKGNKIDYYKKLQKTPFDYKLSTYISSPKMPYEPTFMQKYSIGFLTPAQYLIYDQKSSVYQSASLKNSGIKDGDRILWANGKFIFSRGSLMNLINDDYVFLTLKRGDKYFHRRIKKIKVEELNLNKFDLEEIDDWRYESNLENKLSDIYFLPYFFNEKLVIEKELNFLNSDIANDAMQIDPRSNFKESISKGDKIVAINGVKIYSNYDLISMLQKKQILLIVERKPNINIVSTKNADKQFDSVFLKNDINKIISSIGIDESNLKIDSNIVLLNPIIPIAYDKLIDLSDAQNVNKEEFKGYYALGIGLKDGRVKYNPNPFSMIYMSFSDIYRSLKYLFSGKVSPKHMVGPIGIGQMIHKSFSLGFFEALFFLGVISINLGFLNLLPIPILDGGHIVFSIIEKIRKKPISFQTMEKISFYFFVLLIIGMIFFTYNDILRIIKSFF